MPKHSKLQKQVLSLYKDFLRASSKKPGVKAYVQAEFKKNSSIPKTDILRIEHILRRSFRQLEQLKKTSVQSMDVFE